MSETTLHIKGMTCKKCVETIENSLLKTKGVERALVDLNEGTAIVQYDQQQVKEEQLTEIIRNTGYELA
jgi:copper chaperone